MPSGLRPLVLFVVAFLLTATLLGGVDHQVRNVFETGLLVSSRLPYVKAHAQTPAGQRFAATPSVLLPSARQPTRKRSASSEHDSGSTDGVHLRALVPLLTLLGLALLPARLAFASVLSRREALYYSAATAAALQIAGSPPPATAAGVQFPPARLKNRYVLMRAGQSPMEERGILFTNPVLATQLSTNGLSLTGRQQVVQTLEALRQIGFEDEPLWIWPSITARCYESAEILAEGLGTGRSRLVPEFVFLNARAVGTFERQPADRMEEIYAQDAIDTAIRPPRFTDGTPNESVNDVLVRVGQLLSKTETQYSGVTVILISPDSDNLSVLQAALTGVDLRRHPTLAFRPGEARLIDLTRAYEPPEP